MDHDVYIAGIYIWVENSPMYNLVNADLFDLLESDIHHFQALGKVVLCGDWNARVGSRPDYIVCDRNIDCLNAPDYIADEPCARKTLDKGSNGHGLKMLDLCKSTSVRIANGRIGSDHSTGTFTYACSSGASVIDYVVVGAYDFNCIDNFVINPFNEWSDHTPLSFSINCGRMRGSIDSRYTRTDIKWNEALRDNFRSGLIARLTELNLLVNSLDIHERESIDDCVNKFSCILQEVANPLFSKTTSHTNKCTTSVSDNKLCKKAEWFDAECVEAKRLYLDAVKKFNLSKTDENRTSMCTLKTSYKQLGRKKKRNFVRNKVRTIENMRHAKPRDFWKLFTKKKRNNNNISL